MLFIAAYAHDGEALGPWLTWPEFSDAPLQLPRDLPGESLRWAGAGGGEGDGVDCSSNGGRKRTCGRLSESSAARELSEIRWAQSVAR